MIKYNPKLKEKARCLRAQMTDGERALWARLRRKQVLSVQFYTQKPIANYIVDFYAPRATRRALDAVSVACLVALGAWMGLPYPYFAACVLAAALLVFKYRLVSPSDLSRLGVTFMRVNAYVSSIMFAGTLIAVLMP